MPGLGVDCGLRAILTDGDFKCLASILSLQAKQFLQVQPVEFRRHSTKLLLLPFVMEWCALETPDPSGSKPPLVYRKRTPVSSSDTLHSRCAESGSWVRGAD